MIQIRSSEKCIINEINIRVKMIFSIKFTKVIRNGLKIQLTSNKLTMKLKQFQFPFCCTVKVHSSWALSKRKITDQ